MRFLTFRDKKKLTTSKCTLKISIFANTMSNIIHMKATREYFVDVIKVIDEIKEKDGCNPDDIFDELSPEHGQAIMDQLIQRSCIESTFDGWFVNNKLKFPTLWRVFFNDLFYCLLATYMSYVIQAALSSCSRASIIT